jgi:hypothetical protein
VLPVLLAALAAGPAFAASPSPSRPLSGWDGGTLGAGTTAAYAGLGWPAVEAGVRFGVADALDLGFDGSWQYPRGWVEGDLTGRYLLWGRDRLSFSGVARLGVFRDTGRDGLNDHEQADTGAVLGLGLGAGYRLGVELLTAGVDVPFAVGFEEGSTHLPLLVSLGLDHPLRGFGRQASLGLGVEAGPWGVGGPGESFFYWAVVVRGTHGL